MSRAANPTVRDLGAEVPAPLRRARLDTVAPADLDELLEGAPDQDITVPVAALRSWRRHVRETLIAELDLVRPRLGFVIVVELPGERELRYARPHHLGRRDRYDRPCTTAHLEEAFIFDRHDGYAAARSVLDGWLDAGIQWALHARPMALQLEAPVVVRPT